MLQAWNIWLPIAGHFPWPQICWRASVIRLAVALFGEELSPRFCFAKVASLVEWDGLHARNIGQVQLGTLPYPARLEVLAEQGVVGLLCGSFPRERLVDAARCGISVHCGVSGRVPVVEDELTDFVANLGLPCEKPRIGEVAAQTGRTRRRPA